MFTCDVGDVPQIKVVFTDATGAVIDPTTVVLYLRTPAGVTSSYTYAAGQVTRQAAGTYYYQGTATAAGYWNVRWVGDGAAVAAEQSQFYARGTIT